MHLVEKRKHPRVKTHNLISYICLDNDGRQIKKSMGTALDISQGGLLLETTQWIEPGDIILITADEQDQIIEINAKAAYCREIAGGKFYVGVKFQGAHAKNIQFVKSMVLSYHYCKVSAQSSC